MASATAFVRILAVAARGRPARSTSAAPCAPSSFIGHWGCSGLLEGGQRPEAQPCPAGAAAYTVCTLHFHAYFFT